METLENVLPADMERRIVNLRFIIEFTIGKSAFILLFVLLWVAPSLLKAQSSAKKDTTFILINDLRIQLECTQALNDLYNFKFEKSVAGFQEMRMTYKWHPL